MASDLNNINAFIYKYLIYSKYQNATDFNINEYGGTKDEYNLPSTQKEGEKKPREISRDLPRVSVNLLTGALAVSTITFID